MKIPLVTALLALAFAPLAIGGETTPTMSIDEVRKGMKGYGLTVFEGSDIERFDVEITGILRNIGPGRNVILASVDSEVTDKSGVIAGMSGSPIYIDGKLIGALAYSWMFSSAPIAGITPIDEMIAIEEHAQGAGARLSPWANSKEILSALASGEVAQLQSIFDRMIPAIESPWAGGAPIATPLNVSSFSGATVDRFSSVFRSGGFLPVPTGSASSGTTAGATDDRLEPGDPLAAVLIEGDFSIAATGTVTAVDGNRVYGFGHPFLHMGDIDFPMAQSEIVTVMPSLASSFKLSNTGNVIGSLSQDRYAGVYGTIGETSDLIPVNFRIQSPAGDRDFAVRAVRQPQLFPVLLAMTADNILTSAQQGSGEQSVFMDSVFHVSGREPIRIREGWAGMTARQGIPLYLAVVSGYLLSNEFQNVEIEGIDVTLHHDTTPRMTRIVEASIETPPDGAINPGDVVRLRALLKPYRGEARLETFEIDIPESTVPGPAYLFIGSGSALTRLDFSLVPPDPRSLEQVVRVLERLEPSTDLSIRLYTPAAGLVSSGAYLPNLPPSMQAVTVSERSGTPGALVQYHPARQFVRSFDEVLIGAHRIDLKIETAR
ncbi:MAG: hypothetical protein KY459_14885 [Acidobacteria bacterium]|nr:hypothetical protein [Acidobacteriota bacterium]